MTNLRELNSAVQNSTYPGHEFAQAVREWIAAATERMEPESESAKVETTADRIAADLNAGTFRGVSAFPVGNCPTCGDLVAPWNKHAKYEGGYSCEISELDDRHNRMASPEYQAKFKADRLVGVSYRPVSETVAVGTWQLEELLKYADLAEVALRTGFHPPEFLFRPADRSLRQVIDAVKKQRDEQRAHPQPVGITEELESVLRSAKEYEMAVRTGTRVEWHAYDADRIGAAIAAVRSQYRRKG